jgi:hypothetical protein
MRTIKKFYLQFVATVDQGKQMEILEADEKGDEIPYGLKPVAMFVADENGDLMLQLFHRDGTVQLPVAEMEKAIAVAKREVRNEAFYEAQNDGGWT